MAIRRHPDFKPIPDEEGTETRERGQLAESLACFKPIPDEEGTETAIRGVGIGEADIDCFKPIPNEEGTETVLTPWSSQSRTQASNRSPMRRGLKLLRPGPELTACARFKPIPDEEGTETNMKAG